MDKSKIGTLVVDEITLEEAKEIMKHRKGRWITPSGWNKCMSAEVFAILTHGFPSMIKEEYVEFDK